MRRLLGRRSKLLILAAVPLIVLAIWVVMGRFNRPHGGIHLRTEAPLWEGIPIEQRRHYLDDLLRQPWKRNSKISDISKTRLNGLNKQEVLALLGPTQDDNLPHSLGYKLGDLENEGSLSNKLVPGFATMDVLVIDFDPETGLVTEIIITN